MRKDASKITKLKFAVLFSGGKDSTFSAYIATSFGWDVKCLVTINPKNNLSNLFHSPNIDVTTCQAEAIGLPLIIQETSGEKDEELGDLFEAMKKAKKEHGINGLVVGALESRDKYEKIGKICDELKLKIFAPLWQKDQATILKEMIDFGLDIRISSVAADGLGEKWLGRKLDINAYNELMQLHHRLGINTAGDAGEYESLVMYCPNLFKKRLEIKKADSSMTSEFIGNFEIKEVEFV
ncbi:TIGR00289 family protein [Candidatus Woesearchaeota archaeon CG10_big_fil_rev_8_21_14_0_10_34_8]|nr:MAG: TIGR00289 family protein [Candidatus Woesearchaeota archaeon CG10_big_fil_rev_8_21_14_0_10_34_8]